MSLLSRVALAKAEALLLRRLEELTARVQGEPGLWAELCDTVRTLASIPAPESTGALLTSREAAGKLGVSVKTLLRRKANGEIKPTLEQGKFLRWGRELLVTADPGGRRRKGAGR
jgi:hypothetical protein